MGAIDDLKDLGKKKARPPLAKAPRALNDPAIADGAHDGDKVVLGFDSGFAGRARDAGAAWQALTKAKQNFEILQSEVRDYGQSKRDLWNATFGEQVATVCIPYRARVPSGDEQTKHIQVTCSSRYSVLQEVVLAHREKFGLHFDALFEVDEVRTLKPNAGELLEGVFKELGIKGAQLERVMGELFDRTEKVRVRHGYEQTSRLVPPFVADVLEKAVTRAQPATKFT